MDQAENTPPLVISVPEAGRRLGIGRSSAYAAAARGEIPTVRFGGLLRVPLRAIERLLDAAAKGAIAK
jgi:excisionase family DNA binding protein